MEERYYAPTSSSSYRPLGPNGMLQMPPGGEVPRSIQPSAAINSSQANQMRYSMGPVPRMQGMQTNMQNIQNQQGRQQIGNVNNNLVPRGMQPTNTISNNRPGQQNISQLTSSGPQPTRQTPQMGPNVMRMNPMMTQSMTTPYNPTSHTTFQSRGQNIPNVTQNTNTAFDSEFPALTAGRVIDNQKSPRNEYKLSQDEFPALVGGPLSHAIDNNKDLHDQMGYQYQSAPQSMIRPPVSIQTPFDQQQKQPQQQQPYGTAAKRSMDNKYGLLGLLDVIRMTNHDLNELALGTDLTTLGLNLTSPDSLYNSFLSPFHEPLKQDNEPAVPRGYKQPPMQPAFKKTEHFADETLFYIFYSMPKDIMQLAAAKELYARDWRFHKVKQRWFQPTAQPKPGAVSDRGTYYYFEPSTWEKLKKTNFTMNFRDLEQRPIVPN